MSLTLRIVVRRFISFQYMCSQLIGMLFGPQIRADDGFVHCDWMRQSIEQEVTDTFIAVHIS